MLLHQCKATNVVSYKTDLGEAQFMVLQDGARACQEGFNVYNFKTTQLAWLPLTTEVEWVGLTQIDTNLNSYTDYLMICGHKIRISIERPPIIECDNKSVFERAKPFIQSQICENTLDGNFALEDFKIDWKKN